MPEPLVETTPPGRRRCRTTSTDDVPGPLVGQGRCANHPLVMPSEQGRLAAHLAGVGHGRRVGQRCQIDRPGDVGVEPPGE